MSFKTEFFSGHWWDDGLYFGTRDEAVAYGAASGRQFRVVETTEEANYRWRDGKLLPGAEAILTPSAWEKLWNDIHKQGIHGGIVWEDIYGQHSLFMADTLRQSLKQTFDESIGKAYERVFYHGTMHIPGQPIGGP